MRNRDVFLKDPLENRLVNQGVAEVVEPGSEEELRTLRHELETFVCEGQYAKGLERILGAYLANLNREEQPAVWVSGFYGSGKSHLVKVLRFLWTDYRFADGATARGLVSVTNDIGAMLRELTTHGRRMGGLYAAGGKLGARAGNSVRLALLSIIFRSAGLPEDYAEAQFVLFLKRNGLYETVRQTVEQAGRRFERELHDLYVSPVLAGAVLKADPAFAPNEQGVRAQIKAQFVRPSDISDIELATAIQDALAGSGSLPCTLIALDEVQQYIGYDDNRSYQIQELAEACAKRFGARLLFVGTGQTAITGTPLLQRLQPRFKLAVELSDADVDAVVRKIILAKKPDKVGDLGRFIDSCSGEISRHLAGTKLAPRTEDRAVLTADYPLLPTRRRFWEVAMRAVDPTGTRAELRNQLANVFEAVRTVADRQLGVVAPADFLYDQNKTQLVQTGALLRDTQEAIERLCDGSEDGRLKSRLCALCFLIGKLPREAGADTGLRAKPEVLADLLIEDLNLGSAELRRRIPALLDQLTEAGTLVQVDDEYRIQTRESAAWEADYRNRFDRVRNDEQALALERADLLRGLLDDTLKKLRIPQGQSKVQRRVAAYYWQERPPEEGHDVPVWVRDGWIEDEKAALADARASGMDSPLITVFLPRLAPDDLKKYMASAKAAGEVLNAKGIPTTPEGLEARSGMETRQQMAEKNRDNILNDVLGKARVVLAGGIDKQGETAPDRVREAANDAIQRLYPHFAEADSGHWDKVLERARKGDSNALEAIGYDGPAEEHAVCRAILAFTAGGKKGRDIRKHFTDPPFGWSQDAVDGSLIILVGSEHLRAAQDGQHIGAKQLDQRNIGITDFKPELTTVTLEQRLELRKLFQLLGVKTKPHEEASSARAFLDAVVQLAASAGGEPPLPPPPSPPRLQDLQRLVGNEQLLAIYHDCSDIGTWISEWQKQGALAEERLPRWKQLKRLADHATTLPVYGQVSPQLQALQAERLLLEDPDPINPLLVPLCHSLRSALNEARLSYEQVHRSESEHLQASEIWQRLNPLQQSEILTKLRIAVIADVAVGTEQEILASLDMCSLEAWAIGREDLPGRFAQALEHAAKLLEPKSIQARLPAATIHSEPELQAWLDKAAEVVRKHLSSGPVIVR